MSTNLCTVLNSNGALFPTSYAWGFPNNTCFVKTNLLCEGSQQSPSLQSHKGSHALKHTSGPTLHPTLLQVLPTWMNGEQVWS